MVVNQSTDRQFFFNNFPDGDFPGICMNQGFPGETEMRVEPHRRLSSNGTRIPVAAHRIAEVSLGILGRCQFNFWEVGFVFFVTDYVTGLVR